MSKLPDLMDQILDTAEYHGLNHITVTIDLTPAYHVRHVTIVIEETP